MNTEQTDDRTARPAEEEIKNHGDKLGRQVDDAAGKRAPEKDDKADDNAGDG